MTIKLNWKFSIAFLSLIFVMHEAHEIVHTTFGRIICGCWGERDFNVWGLCEDCEEKHPIALLATFLGPLFTFIMIWVGCYFLKSHHTNQQKSLGFALIFANMPFARILTASFGSGDEVWGLNQLLHNYTAAWVIGLSLTISNKKRICIFILFLLVPIALDLLFVLGLMNTLLSAGILSTYWILGSPILVTVWTILVLCIFILTRKNIYTLAD
jgi:hypothetical protein